MVTLQWVSKQKGTECENQKATDNNPQNFTKHPATKSLDHCKSLTRYCHRLPSISNQHI